MGKTISTYVAFDKAMVKEGKAVLKDNQLSSIEAASAARLSKNLTYIIPKQWVHVSDLRRPINGNTQSLRVYAFGFDNKGNLAELQEISVSSLRQRHYGTVDTAAPSAKIRLNPDGLRRIEEGISNFGVCKGTDVPFATSGKSAYIPRTMALKLDQRSDCYVLGFVQTPKGWDVKHVEDNGEEFVHFDKRALNLYEEVDSDLSMDWTSVSDVNAESFKDLPL